jgi:hypothetical protein
VDTFVYSLKIERAKQLYAGDFEARFLFSVPSWHLGAAQGNRVLRRVALAGTRNAGGTKTVRAVTCAAPTCMMLTTTWSAEVAAAHLHHDCSCTLCAPLVSLVVRRRQTFG